MDGDTAGSTPAAAQQAIGKAGNGSTPSRRARKSRSVVTPPAAVRVTLLDPGAFFDELEHDAGDIDDAIVRVAVQELPKDPGYTRRELTLYAGYLVRGQVVELVTGPDGYYAEKDNAPARASSVIGAVLEQLTNLCEARELEVRAGRFGAL